MGDVWSYDEENQKFIAAPIVSHHFNGIANDGELLTVTTEAFDTRNGVLSGTFSYTHKILTGGGWKPAIALAVGDTVVTRYRSQINGSLRQFLLGTACGDLTLLVTNAYGNSHKAIMKIEDSENHEYACWKVDMLSSFFSFTEKASPRKPTIPASPG
jgi:recombination protein RecA